MESNPCPKILIISSCTKSKDYSGIIPKPTNITDLHNAIKNGIFNGYEKMAKDMYLGKAHIAVKDAIKIFNANGLNVDWRILSAGYGLLEPHEKIIPYEITFNGETNSNIIAMSNQTNISQTFNNLVNNYDIFIFALTPNYLNSIQFDKINDLNGKKIVVIDSESSKGKNEIVKTIIEKNNLYFEWLIKDCRKYGGRTPFRGYLLKQISQKSSVINEFLSFVKDMVF